MKGVSVILNMAVRTIFTIQQHNDADDDDYDAKDKSR